MNLFDHASMASEAIRSNPLRALLTTLGVLIGVLAVILLVGLGDAVRSYVLEEFAGIGSNVLQVRAGRQETRGMQPPSMNVRNRLTMLDVQALERRAFLLDGVSPVVFSTSELRHRDLRRSVLVIGVGARYGDIRNLRVARGRFISDDDVEGSKKVIVVGETIVRELFGDGENPLGEMLYVSSTPFHIVGITEPKGKTFGFDMDDLAFIPATSAQALFDVETLSEIVSRARDRNNVEPAIEEIREVLATRRSGSVDFTVFSQDDMMDTVNSIMDTLTFFLGAIASISLLVGGIGIMNIMLVSVGERTREIGVRRALGARWRDILMQFLVESVVLSLLGGVLGIILGFLIIKIVQRIEPALPVELSFWNLSLALGFSVIVGIVSGVSPAVRAANLDPVEALRHE